MYSFDTFILIYIAFGFLAVWIYKKVNKINKPNQ